MASFAAQVEARSKERDRLKHRKVCVLPTGGKSGPQSTHKTDIPTTGVC